MAKELTREALYELVWSKPMRSAAADVGISDVGLKKRCRSLGVPVPPQGYWNRVLAGHRMPERPTLPPPPPPPLPKTTQRAELPAAIPIPPNATEPVAKASTSTPKAATKKMPRRRRRNYREAFYVMPIDAWEWDYDFGVSASFTRDGVDEVRDYAHLHVRGTLIRPRSLAGRRFEATLIPERRDPAQYREAPEWIADIHRSGRGKGLEAVARVPIDVLSSLLVMLQAGRLRFFTLSGEPLYRSAANIRQYAFRRFMYQEDLDLDLD